jgi:hypothetical protein
MLRGIRGVEFQRNAARWLDLSVPDLDLAKVVLGRQISATAKHWRLRAVQTCVGCKNRELRGIVCVRAVYFPIVPLVQPRALGLLWRRQKDIFIISI